MPQIDWKTVAVSVVLAVGIGWFLGSMRAPRYEFHPPGPHLGLVFDRFTGDVYAVRDEWWVHYGNPKEVAKEKLFFRESEKPIER